MKYLRAAACKDRSADGREIATACADVRHDHHRRRHVGTGGRHSAGHIRSARVCILERHYDDRRVEFVLSARRPQLRRRSARASPTFTPTRRRDTAHCHDCCGNCGFRGTIFELAPQIGSAIAFPRRQAAVQQRLRAAWPRRSREHFPREQTTFGGCCGRFSTTTTSAARTCQRVGPRGVGRIHHPIRCWSKCCFAR